MKWNVYILECGDMTLYTGITNDIDRRLKAHRNGYGAKYTCGRGPLKLIYSEFYETRASALKREAEIKRLSRNKKLGLVGDPLL